MNGIEQMSVQFQALRKVDRNVRSIFFSSVCTQSEFVKTAQNFPNQFCSREYLKIETPRKRETDEATSSLIRSIAYFCTTYRSESGCRIVGSYRSFGFEPAA